MKFHKLYLQNIQSFTYFSETIITPALQQHKLIMNLLLLKSIQYISLNYNSCSFQVYLCHFDLCPMNTDQSQLKLVLGVKNNNTKFLKLFFMLKQTKNINNQLAPTCSILTSLKIFNPQTQPFRNKSSFAKSQEENSSTNNGKYFPSPNLQMSIDRPNSLVFHHFQKYNTFQFQFDRIYDQKTHNINISAQYDLYEQVIEGNRDLCVLAIGGQKSGLSQLCQGRNGVQGIFYSIISKLWDRLSSQNKQKGGVEGNGGLSVNQSQLFLKFIVIFNDKLKDLLSPKNEVSLKQNGQRSVFIGCSTYQVKSIYDLFLKINELYDIKQRLYPQSILIIQGELIISSAVDFQNIEQTNHRYFSLVQWQKNMMKSQSNRNNHNNNQSLLTLNMCIYELYKFSCHDLDRVGYNQIKQLWSNFRNSYFTKMLKNYLVQENYIHVIGCVAADQTQESDAFQTLMLCKNISKIQFQGKQQKNTKPIFNRKNLHLKDRVQTQPVESDEYSKSFEKDFNNLQKVKFQLKRILLQKQTQQQKQKQRTVLEILKMQSGKKLQLESIRYKKQQMKVREDVAKMKVYSFNNSRIISRSKQTVVRQRKNSLLPKLQSKTKQMKAVPKQVEQQQLKHLNQMEQSTVKQIQQLHHQLLNHLPKQCKPEMGINVLKAEIKMQQKEMMSYINHKQKILRLLKQQAQSIKNNEIISNNPTPILSRNYHRRAKSKLTQHFTQSLPTQQNQQQHHEEPTKASQNEANPEQEMKQYYSIDPIKFQNLKKLNKGNYLFEKRRMELKAKVSKGREDINKFYEQAALKFQNYKAK